MIKGINKQRISKNLLSLDIARKVKEIKKTIIENSKPTIPIIDMLGFKKIKTIKK